LYFRPVLQDVGETGAGIPMQAFLMTHIILTYAFKVSFIIYCQPWILSFLEHPHSLHINRTLHLDSSLQLSPTRPQKLRPRPKKKMNERGLKTKISSGVFNRSMQVLSRSSSRSRLQDNLFFTAIATSGTRSDVSYS
jgi:hypothetical protein